MAEFRPFGRPEDLDLELQPGRAEQAVTELLTRCSVGPRSRSWWDETVGARIAALMRLVLMTEPAVSFSVPLRCGEPGCGTALEVELPLEAMQAAVNVEARFSVTLPSGDTVTVRAPVGADQRAWRSRAYATRDEAVATMLDALVVDGEVAAADGEAVNAVAAALAEHDPLVAFTVSYVCPACGARRDHVIDLERLALDRLVAVRRSLIQDVHALASSYGWTEAEVLALPPQRRAVYRSLIDEAAQ